jgi:four helix bundle protein
MNNELISKSKTFAVEVMKLCERTKSSPLIEKLLLNGTGIGSNIHDASHSIDTDAKMRVALEMCCAAEYLLTLLLDSGSINDKQILADCLQLKEMITNHMSGGKSVCDKPACDEDDEEEVEEEIPTPVQPAPQPQPEPRPAPLIQAKEEEEDDEEEVEEEEVPPEPEPSKPMSGGFNFGALCATSVQHLKNEICTKEESPAEEKVEEEQTNHEEEKPTTETCRSFPTNFINQFRK